VEEDYKEGGYAALIKVSKIRWSRNH